MAVFNGVFAATRGKDPVFSFPTADPLPKQTEITVKAHALLTKHSLCGR
ncbi:hypothetical protein JOF55_000103 [Haloactinomyces albus]|uniref:Uncharacterized protein n=1 Tax=Haloactinomyces albus TaxID=1352928 RepID=A0AAE4CLH2_9ACTN|nr:hypothetical protein [Haloactinomyces albus]